MAKIEVSALELMSRAQATAGVGIDDASIREPLERLLRSLNEEARLSEAGARGMERHILRVLANRLRMERDFRAHPEIESRRIVRPLIICGGPRAGSTKLHKLLAASGDFRYLRCWQGINFARFEAGREEDTAARIEDAEERIRWFNERAPQSKLIHEFSTFEPEEENLIYEHRFYGPYLSPFVQVPGYIRWYMANIDFREELKYLERVLKYLEWQFFDDDPRPWLLKNPGYIGYEPLILEVFPDATLATTHRDPVSVVSSGTSLNTRFHEAYSDADYRAIMGTFVMQGIAGSWRSHMNVRDAHPRLSILDVSYTELTRNGELAAQKVYAHAGLPLEAKSRRAMLDWDRGQDIHVLGAHRHSLASFAVTPEAIRAEFKSYIERFSNWF
jgi:hypothetical protein